MPTNRIGLNSFSTFLNEISNNPGRSLGEVTLASITQSLHFAAKNNFDFVEVALDYPLLDDPALEGRLRDALREIAMPINIHASFIDLSLASHNPYVQAATLKAITSAVSFGKEFHAGAVTFHPGVRNSPIMYHDDFYLSNLVHGLHQVIQNHPGRSPRLCIENMPAHCQLLGKIAEIQKVLATPGLEDLFLTYDTSHLYTCNEDPVAYWNAFHDRVGNVHLVDNRFRDNDPHIPLGHGEVDFPLIARLLREHAYPYDILIELQSPYQCKRGRAYFQQFFSHV